MFTPKKNNNDFLAAGNSSHYPDVPNCLRMLDFFYYLECFVLEYFCLNQNPTMVDTLQLS